MAILFAFARAICIQGIHRLQRKSGSVLIRQSNQETKNCNPSWETAPHFHTVEREGHRQRLSTLADRPRSNRYVH